MAQSTPLPEVRWVRRLRRAIDWQRLSRAVAGRRSLTLVGGLLAILAVGLAYRLALEGSPWFDIFVAFVLSAGPGAIIVYRSFQLPDTDIDPAFYPIIGAWCFGSVVVTATALGAYHLQPAAGYLTQPARIILNLASLGGLAGYAIGFQNARARTRANELAERNRELLDAREELEEYERIVETVDDGVYVLDEAGRFQRVNDAFTSMTYFDRPELLGTHASAVFGEKFDDLDAEAQRQFESGETDVATFEEEIYTAEGEEIVVESQFKQFEVGGGLGRVGVVRDITDLKEYQRKLEESNERLEQFAYVASHDLQEPLRMVSSYLQLLEGRYADELDEDAVEFIEFAVDGADRMRAMIEDLLAYSRVDTEAAPLEPTDSEAVVGNALRNLERQIEENDADVEVGSLPTVEADANQLEQVFQNLVSNAIKYRGEETPRIEIDAERDGTEWAFRVADNGIGMDPEQTDRIFDVFERLHRDEAYSGTGIGLALCEKIVDRHGGDIWVESEPGVGSTFYFTVPDADGSRGGDEESDGRTTAEG